ncbi:ankyrin repeat domain-containing protein 26-like [Lemur catta]|uniref:ankyrin repeat domain-containing protein 26-like n=1 Tax=Lemur catta TaxID=9447 RepID=UPI001E267F18|nr:ankyrin repeat domain-containing protein 26-like [Lemur catta]
MSLLTSGPKEEEASPPRDSDSEEGTANPSTTKMENGISIIENAPQVRNANGSFTAVCRSNRSDKMSALEPGENEVVEVPLDSACESVSKSPVQKDVGPSSRAVDQKGRNTVNGQIEGSYHENLSSSPHSDRASKVYLKEELRQDTQKFKNEVDMLQVELLSVEKEKGLLEKEISHSQEREKDLLHKNRMLQEELAMVRMERDKIKSQNEENEKKYPKDTEITKEKYDDVYMTLLRNLETLNKTVCQYGEKLCVLTAENAMLKCKLESETQNKERLEEELASCHSRLTAATRDLDERETSRKHLELAFYTARDEWDHLQDKMNFSMSNLKENNEILSEKLSKAESKIDSLETELHHTRELLREKTLFLEVVQRDLRQTQCQTEEIEQTYGSDQSKVNPHMGEQESLEQRFCELQRENMLLRQQLHAAHNKAAQKDETVTNIQDQLQDIVKQSQAGSDKQSLLLEGKLQELTNECDRLKETMCHLEKESAERTVLVRHLQELATTLKKQPRPEAFVEVSPCHVNLEDGTGSKKKIDQIKSQIDQQKQALEFPCSKCGRQYAKNQVVQPESLPKEIIQERYEKLQTKNMRLKQAIVDLKNYMERNMVDRHQADQYKREIKAKAEQTVAEKFKKINLFLQAYAAQRDNRQELREKEVAAVKREMELKVKFLESKLHKMKMYQEFNNVELQKISYSMKLEGEAKKSLACGPETLHTSFLHPCGSVQRQAETVHRITKPSSTSQITLDIPTAQGPLGLLRRMPLR